MTQPPEILLPRTITLGTKGLDVIALARGLSRAGYMEWGPFTDVYGNFKRDAVHRFQIDRHIKPAGYGPFTHDLLRRTHKKDSIEWAFDSVAIDLMHKAYNLYHITTETEIRNKIIQMARYLYSYRNQIAYDQYRPFPLLHIGDPPPRRLDCSGFFTSCWYAAGAKKNPNANADGSRFAWNGTGYTISLWRGGRKVRKELLKPGDAVLYGFTEKETEYFPKGSPTHVALWEGHDDLVISNGSHPMGRYPYNYRDDINCFMTYEVM
jgi:hypothetical protein